MPERLQQAEGLVWDWLKGEQPYQFIKIQGISKADAEKSLAEIMGHELKNTWYQFRSYRDKHSHNPHGNSALHAGQQILKATAAARAAAVWGGVVKGTSFMRANQSTFSVLHQHFQIINQRVLELPAPDLLDATFEEAIWPQSTTPIEGQYRPLPVFTTLAGHAINHLLAQAEDTGNMSVPRPGLPNGAIEPWRSVHIPPQTVSD